MMGATVVVCCFGFLLFAVLPFEASGQYNPYGSNYLSGYSQLSSENQARLYQAQLQQQNWLFQQQLNQQGNQQVYLQQQAAALSAGQAGATGQYRYPLVATSAVYTPYSGVLASNVVPSVYSQYQGSSLGSLGTGLYGNTGMVDV